jgi:hypothetical protein
MVSFGNTTDFIGNWSTGPNSFTADPPNAVLILDDEEERQELAVIELFNPEYDPEANTLKYDITAVNATAVDLPDEFGQSTMVIDDDGATSNILEHLIRNDFIVWLDEQSQLHVTGTNGDDH